MSGFRDWTIEGVHLCTTRLSLLSLNAALAMDPEALAVALTEYHGIRIVTPRDFA